jgi:chromate transporter
MNINRTSSHISPAHISRADAFRFWLKLGFISFGGPAGQIAIMHRELVETRRWVSERRFMHALNYCMVLPGPEAQQLATYLGWLMHGTVGGIIAGVLFILPSFFILLTLSWIYASFGDMPLIKGIFDGIKPAVAAIVLHAAWRIGGRTLKNGGLVAIALAAFIAIFFFDVPFPVIVLLAALIGMIGVRFYPRQFQTSASHLPLSTRNEAAYIDDSTPPPPHAVFTRAGLWRVAITGVLLWIGVFGLLVWHGGLAATLTQMAWFFTKAAMLTFGGAYAVLPYVYQGAVETFQWVTPQQMMDGLALGETTPGPLIMVIAFVAYLGGVANDVAGANAFLSGALAATVVTFFTFLPSFIFIFVGAPLIESTRDNLRLAAPLNAITAAVVGVILSLALFFVWHAWWPVGLSNTGFTQSVNWLAVVITLGAAIALFRYHTNVIWVIVVSGVIGVVAKLLALPIA